MFVMNINNNKNNKKIHYHLNVIEGFCLNPLEDYFKINYFRYGILLRTLNNSEELTKLLEEMFFINFANTEYDSLAFLPTVHNLITHYCYQDVHKVK